MHGLALILALAASLLLPWAALAPVAAQAQQTPQRVVPQSRQDIQISFAPVVRRAAPAVVKDRKSVV